MVFEKIAEILAEKLDCDPSEIKEDAAFADMGIDSLDITELIMNIEDEFDIELEMDKSLEKVSDLVKKVEELKA